MIPTGWNVLVVGSAAKTSRTRPAAHRRVVGECDLYQGPRTRADELFGYIEHRIASALTRYVHDRLSGADHLARLGTSCGYHAGSIGEQVGVIQLILLDAHLGTSGIHLGLGAAKGLFGVVKFCASRPATGQKLLLTAKGQAGLRQHGLGRGETGLCRAQRVLLVLRVELSDDLARLENVTDIDEPLDHVSVEAEGKADLVLGANLARQRYGLALRTALDSDRPDRSYLGCGGLFTVAAREGRRDQGGH